MGKRLIAPMGQQAPAGCATRSRPAGRRGVLLRQRHATRRTARRAQAAGRPGTSGQPRDRSGNAQPRDLVAMRDTLHNLPDRAQPCSRSGRNHAVAGAHYARLSDLLPDELSLLECGLDRRPARHPGQHRHHPRRLLGRTGWGDRSLASTPASGSPTWKRVERERTGIKTLKVGYNKVFGYYIEISAAARRPGARRLHPQADAGQRRALHHPGDEGVRDAGAERRGTHPRDRDAPVPGGLRGSWPKSARHAARNGARPGRAGRAGGAGRGGRAGRLRPPRGPGRRTCWTSATAATRSSSEVCSGERFVPNDIAFESGEARARHHRAEHERQEHLPAPGGADRADGADGQLRAGRLGAASGWWTASSPASARRTRSTPGSPPSWSR